MRNNGINTSQEWKINFSKLMDLLESPRITTLSKKQREFLYDIEEQANKEKERLKLTTKQKDWLYHLHDVLFK